MQSREAPTYEVEHSRMATISNPAPQSETPLHADDEAHEQVIETGAYTTEEEALVEERLKNLGYL